MLKCMILIDVMRRLSNAANCHRIYVAASEIRAMPLQIRNPFVQEISTKTIIFGLCLSGEMAVMIL